MNGSDFLQFAGKLAALPDDSPAAMRTVASRAYYSIFHAGKELLGGIDCHIPRRENAHKSLVIYLENSGCDAAIEVASMISDLHDRRRRADYELGEVECDTREFARDAVERASAISARLGKFSDDELRASTKSGIKKYLSGSKPA